MKGLTSAWALVVTLAGCAHHPALVLPPATSAPRDARLAHYQAHRPVLVEKPGVRQLLWHTERMTLADGLVVEEAEALLPTVGATSPTAQAVARAQTAQERLYWLVPVSSILLAGGAAAFALGSALAMPPAPMGQAVPTSTTATLAASGLVGVALGLGVLIFTGEEAKTVAFERERAFLTYDRSLRERLGLLPSFDDEPDSAPPLLSPPPAPSFELRVEPLPGSCGSPGSFRAFLVEQIGRDPFVDSGSHVILIEGSEQDARFLLRVRVSGPDGRGGAREIVAESCDEARARTALVVATMVEPLLPEGPGESP